MQPLHHPTMSPITALDSPSGTNGTSGSSSGDNSNDASITANDFLTLLVAEMKNQDPTANNDPNAYIDQLVQVNSLQQLIQINQDLSGGTTSSSDGSSDVKQTASHAINAASRLATSLTEKHSQEEVGATERNAKMAAQATESLNTAVHKS